MKILFDNYNHDNTCTSLWGFSLYLEEYNLLFDTGSNGRVLLKNIERLGINIDEIKYIYITHNHWDHIGGIDSILELNNDIRLIVPSSLSKFLINDLKTLCKEVIVCGEKPQKLFDGIYTTGILGDETPEQSLIINDNYPKVITGCGHYGISDIVKISKSIINKDIKFAIGGFHLLHKNKTEIEKSIEDLEILGVKTVLPTHCTGDLAIKLYKEHFKHNYIEGGVGKVWVLNDIQ